MLLHSAPVVRRKMFEIYSASHFLLSLVAATGTLFHVASFRTFQTTLFFGCFGMFILATVKLTRYALIVYNGVRWSGFSATVSKLEGGLIEVRLTMKRKRKINAGSYIYLTLFGSGLQARYMMQSHPMQVARIESATEQNSEEQNGKSGQQNLILLIRPEDGLTKELGKREKVFRPRAWIEGPYGEHRLSQTFEQALLFTSDIGIIGVFPYLDALLAQDNLGLQPNSVILFWSIELPGKHGPRLTEIF